MRYFLKLAYRGTPFVGWQMQTNGLSIQQCLQEALFKVLREPVGLTGCGRTDTGVHAKEFFAHFDGHDSIVPESLKDRINRIVPAEIAIYGIYAVPDDLHARFSATRRTYHYYLASGRDPFREDLVYAFYNFHKLDREKMQKMAELILRHENFYPFCKSHSGVEHYLCKIFVSRWTIIDDDLVYEISANRFLRGMVRLIVGMSIQVGLGKESLDQVMEALLQQRSLDRSFSAPAHGLYLSKVEYPFAFGEGN
ncbi:MAG: tRNA pseudouridine(38-40) synthase TruA [Saprospiraceae bacterium]|nr:tRNA pseudouridine(38-40) synthase TruA [Saprospiraceae bacterium]